jgi:hypothetical protein
MTRIRGRAPRGERLLAKVPHGHWKTTTLIAALGAVGMRCSMVVDGAVNADVFEAFVEKVLLPQLRPGDVVVLDNLSSHKRLKTRTLIESAGAALLYLPPYSPDLTLRDMKFTNRQCLSGSLLLQFRKSPWINSFEKLSHSFLDSFVRRNLEGSREVCAERFCCTTRTRNQEA